MHKVVAKWFEKISVDRFSGCKNIKLTISIAIVLSVILASCVYNVYNQDKAGGALAPSAQAELGPVPDFSAISDVTEKKQAFFDYLRPGIEAENLRVQQERVYLSKVQELFSHQESLSAQQQKSVEALADSYQLPLPEQKVTQEWLDEMNVRVNVLPETLVLTQAANESAWGTSRFARKGNNYFGQWCYQKGCGLVPLQRKDEATHEVARFDSAAESIHRYFMNVNRNQAYAELRRIRAELSRRGESLVSTQAATTLANGLLKYSERGQQYVNDLQAMIRHNEEFWKQ
jgi:Bax protein